MRAQQKRSTKNDRKKVKGIKLPCCSHRADKIKISLNESITPKQVIIKVIGCGHLMLNFNNNIDSAMIPRSYAFIVPSYVIPVIKSYKNMKALLIGKR